MKFLKERMFNLLALIIIITSFVMCGYIIYLLVVYLGIWIHHI